MTVLSDQDISRELGYGDLDVSPVDLDDQLQPNSLDIRLGDEFSVLLGRTTPIDVKDSLEAHHDYSEVKTEQFTIEPGQFVLANTIEDFDIPDYLYGQIHGRSSIGRLGLEVHSTAGLIDSGYTGSITLELKNNSKRAIKLYSEMRIAQVVFHRLESRANNPYSEENDNKYQGQEGIVHSRIEQDFE